MRIMTNGEFRVSAFLIGIGIGLLTGLLWAPRSGEDTRREVRRRTGEGLDYLNQQAEKLRERADKIAAMTKEWIGRQGESLESKATELQKAYQDRSPGA
jgi:gas vesicle protein